jgi:hypothetical protein
MLGNNPDYFINFDPAVFHGKWFRDADAVHLVSFWDIRSSIAKKNNFYLRRLRLKVNGCKRKIWEKYCHMFIEIKKIP